MPARKEEVKHAKEEGIDLRPLTSPIELVGDEKGWLTGVRCQQMELGEPDDSGRRRPVPIEGGDGALDALAWNVPAEAGIEELLAVDLPGAEDEGIADEDSGEAGDDHQRQRPAAADQPAARDQGHVLGQRHAQTTRDQHEENADVGGRPVEVGEEMKEPVLQAAPPRLGRSSEASRSWTGTASSTPDAVAPSLQDDDDRMANPQTASRLKPAAS